MKLKYKTGIVFIIVFGPSFYCIGSIISIIYLDIGIFNNVTSLIAIIITIACSTVISVFTSRYYNKYQLRKLKVIKMNLKYKTGIITIIGFVALFFIIGYAISYLGIPFIGPIYDLDPTIFAIKNTIAIILTIVSSTVVSVVTSRYYYKYQLRKLNLEDTQFNEAIKSLIKEKSEISISDLFNLFYSGDNNEKDAEFRKRLNKKIFSWASKYDFSIQEDKIILTPDNISAFMDDLDKSFDNWYGKNKPKKN